MLFNTGYWERMSIRPRMIILSLSIVHYLGFTKTPDLPFIGCYNIQLESHWMFVTTSVCALSRHEDVRACVVTVLVSYPLHKFILTLSFSYQCLLHISVLTFYHILSTEYVRVIIISLYLFSLCLYAVFDYFFVWSDLNHISNSLLGWGWSHL